LELETGPEDEDGELDVVELESDPEELMVEEITPETVPVISGRLKGS
jgi:hypothetical protein